MMGENTFLTSSDALKQIAVEIQELSTRYESSKSLGICKSFSMSSSLPWPYLATALGVITALFLSSTSFGNASFCALLLLCILVLNVALSIWDARRKFDEISARLHRTIDHLKDVYQNSNFVDCLALDHFADLLKNCDTGAISSSPSHSISRVYRQCAIKCDQKLTPIPSSLLATGDSISLWPGQESPASVQCVEGGNFYLAPGEIFNLSHLESCGAVDHDEGNSLCRRFKVLESPIAAEIQKFLLSVNSVDQNRRETPPTVFERQRTFMHLWLLKFVIPAVLVIAYVTSIIRYLLLPYPTTHDFNSTSYYASGNQTIEITISYSDSYDPVWLTYFIRSPALLCVPLLPLLLPALFILLATVGEAKTLIVSKRGKLKMDCLTSPTALTLSSQAFFIKDEEVDGFKWRDLLPKLLWSKDGSMFHRNAGLFVPLGSLTVLCCVDKEGILSWFNPIVEKVFFFKQNPQSHNGCGEKLHRTAAQKESLDIGMPPVIEESEDQVNGDALGKSDMGRSSDDQKVISETLVLSQDAQDPSRVQFDDVMWEDHLPSLKPIGLDIMLNMCSCLSGRKTFQFRDSSSFLGSEILDKINPHQSLQEDDCSALKFLHERELCAIASTCDCLAPGMQLAKKGLCSLAEIIGFAQNIKLAYKNQQNFTAYRKPICQTRLSSSLDQNASFLSEKLGSFTKRNKWKQYLPHMHGAVVQDLLGDDQILVYGSGDLVIELCKEMWDGGEIQPMAVHYKRKAMDFYQRSSVAGQCIAFAYIPLSQKTSSLNLKNDRAAALVDLSKSLDRKRLQDRLQDTEVFNSMIFLGMTTLQHQARFSVCQMVDTLDRACIRFVYFSADNEVRSRVFAEKMGLETGWNCHISLADNACDSIIHDGKMPQAQNRSESSKSRSSSEGGSTKPKHVLEEDEIEELGNASSHLLERMSPRTQSESSATDSLINVSNRAKLPRGIRNIVPHIENVDNVPLLVPLFTNATQETSAEMIKIMQDYGEVVCCIGSSDCIRNTSVFHHANVSLAIEPVVYPTSNDVSPSQEWSHSTSDASPFPHENEPATVNCIALEVARKLHCFPCSLLLSGDNGLNVIASMITQARHFLFVMRIFFIFLTKCQITLVAILLLSHVLLLPMPFAPMDVFWLGTVTFPVLSLSLLGSPPDRDLMIWANEKTLPNEDPVTRSTQRQTMKVYGMKFLPSIVVLITCYAIALHSSCLVVKDSLVSSRTNSSENTPIAIDPGSTIDVQCYPAFFIAVSSFNVSSGSANTVFRLSLWDATEQLKLKLRAIQLTTMCFFVFYMCIVSVGYVHRWRRLTDSPPYLNKFWCITVPVLISSQVIGAFIVLGVDRSSPDVTEHIRHPLMKTLSSWDILNFGEFQILIWAVFAAWPLPCIVFNELWKWREIKMWNRWQKRARLDFGTKLGMNSPF